MPGAKNVQDLLLARFGLQTFDRETSAQAGVAASQLMRQNPYRLGFVLVNMSIGNNLYIRPRRPPSSTVGIPLGPGEWRSMIYDEDFSLVNQEWFIIASAAASDFYLLEVLTISGESTP